MTGRWVPHDTRDAIVDYVRDWSEKAEVTARRMLAWLGLPSSKYHHWKTRYGQANEHNGQVPRDFWLEDGEKQAIVAFHDRNPLEGYRRLAFMMLDQDVVAVSPSSVYRVLKEHGRLDRFVRKTTGKGQGFQQPLVPHEHWHVDISYVNVCGTFYYLCSLLDGCSRFIVHWELRESMKEVDVEIVLQRAREAYPLARPRIISDNGPQFIARDFKEFIRISGMTHVRTSPYYPQSNGKLERWHGTLKQDRLRPGAPSSVEQAREMVARFVEHYNQRRLHSAIGYVTPADKLHGRDAEIHAARDRKLEAARSERAKRRDQLGSLEPKTTREEARRGVQRGANEHPLVCVNA